MTHITFLTVPYHQNYFCHPLLLQPTRLTTKCIIFKYLSVIHIKIITSEAASHFQKHQLNYANLFLQLILSKITAIDH